jgi:hypothetical protein
MLRGADGGRSGTQPPRRGRMAPSKIRSRGDGRGLCGRERRRGAGAVKALPQRLAIGRCPHGPAVVLFLVLGGRAG